MELFAVRPSAHSQSAPDPHLHAHTRPTALCHIPHLREYFVSDAYLCDINTKSKFGMGGKLAVEFAALVRGLEASESRSLSPQMFKTTVGKFEPRFAGFQQHDAQEFMSRVLEGLGDELNRVLVKEYHELPDSDYKPDVQVARDHWENTLARENHIVTALFTGQLCSRQVCGVTGISSVVFDPFFILPVPLPEEATRTVDVVITFAPATAAHTARRPARGRWSWPQRANVVVPRDATVADLLGVVAALPDTPWAWATLEGRPTLRPAVDLVAAIVSNKVRPQHLIARPRVKTLTLLP